MGFDVSKAIDFVDHCISLGKLSEMGLSGQYVGWFKIYMEDRTFLVKLNNTISISGIPQGPTKYI